MAEQRNAFVVKAVSSDVPSYSIKEVYDDIRKGKARIGWSYKDNLNLESIRNKLDSGGELDEEEKDAKRCLGFRERVKIGDYFIYPHQPEYKKIAIVEVTGDYGYSEAKETFNGDFRSYRPCKMLHSEPIDWNDSIVQSELRKRLGRPGRFSRIYDFEMVERFVSNLDKAGKPDTLESRVNRIMQELQKHLPNLIKSEFSQHDLSRQFCVDLFEKMGLNCELREGRYEKGSDLVVTVASPLMKDEFRVGVQVFAYKDEVTATSLKEKLDQLLNGWQENDLDSGVLLTTGICDEESAALIQKHNREKPDRSVLLIAGPELSELCLMYFFS